MAFILRLPEVRHILACVAEYPGDGCKKRNVVSALNSKKHLDVVIRQDTQRVRDFRDGFIRMTVVNDRLAILVLT